MSGSVSRVLKALKDSHDYSFEGAKLDFALEVKRAMDRHGMNNKALADSLGVSPPMVSKLLRGDANVTLETMVKVAHSLEGKLFLKFVRNGCSARMFELAQTEQHRPHQHRGLPRQSAPGSHVDGAVWALAANDFNVGEGYEAKPLAA